MIIQMTTLKMASTKKGQRGTRRLGENGALEVTTNWEDWCCTRKLWKVRSRTLRGVIRTNYVINIYNLHPTPTPFSKEGRIV